MAQARATLGRARTNQSGAGVGSPRSRRLDEQGTTPTPPKGTRQSRRWDEQGTNKRQRRRAAPRVNGNSATKLGLISHKPLGAGLVVVKPLGNANADPKRRARWRAEQSEGTPIALQSPVGLARGASNDQAGTNTGMILARSPIGRGATTFSRWEARSPAPEGNGTTHSPRNPTPTRGTTRHPFYPPPMTTAANPAAVVSSRMRQGRSLPRNGAGTRECKNGAGGRGGQPFHWTRRNGFAAERAQGGAGKGISERGFSS